MRNEGERCGSRKGGMEVRGMRGGEREGKGRGEGGEREGKGRGEGG